MSGICEWIVASGQYLRNFDMKTVHVYTDGACSGNPGPGSWC